MLYINPKAQRIVTQISEEKTREKLYEHVYKNMWFIDHNAHLSHLGPPVHIKRFLEKKIPKNLIPDFSPILTPTSMKNNPLNSEHLHIHMISIVWSHY